MTARRDDAGSFAIEGAVIMGIAIVVFWGLVMVAGRSSEAANEVRSAAHEGARAASQQGDPGRARAAAESTVATNLIDAGLACGSGPTVIVDLSQFRAGGSVTVEVACTASFSDLGIPAPASHTFRASALEVIDRYRGGA